jgi:hypothetical protein
VHVYIPFPIGSVFIAPSGMVFGKLAIPYRLGSEELSVLRYVGLSILNRLE